MDKPRDREQNRLLAALPHLVYERLLPQMETVHLAAREVLTMPDQALHYVYFPHDAVAALLVPMEDGSAAEGATVGNEGIIGLQVFLGDGISNEEVVEMIPGEALRMRAAHFRAAVQSSPELQGVVHGYTLALMNQMARTAGCNRVHSVEQRFARLLLMTSDRLGRASLAITHEFLSNMLAVRRASVTEAACSLHQSGLIDYHRGHLTIRDRTALEDVACEDYHLARDAYDRLYSVRSSTASARSSVPAEARVTGWPSGDSRIATTRPMTMSNAAINRGISERSASSKDVRMPASARNTNNGSN
jgi:CRP-like cAMP-binding protein